MKRYMIPFLFLVLFMQNAGQTASAFQSPQTDEVTLTIINDSDSDICYVYISPTSATLRGEDRLGSDETIPPQQLRAFILTSGSYNVLLLSCVRDSLL